MLLVTWNSQNHKPTNPAVKDAKPDEFIEHPDGRCLNLNKIISIMDRLERLTLPYRDSEGNSLQLWKIHPSQLIGTVWDKHGQVTVVPAEKIRVLSTKRDPSITIQQLEQSTLKKWQIAFNQQTREMDLWPFMRAAGKDWFVEIEKSPYKNLTKEGVIDKLTRDGFKPAPKASDPANGKGDYIHSQTGERARLDPRNQGRYGEPNHVDYLPKGSTEWVRLYYKDPYGLHQFKWKKPNNGSDPNRPKPLNPATKHFLQLVQQKRLTDTYNNNHRNNPILAKGGTGGDIGGVVQHAHGLQLNTPTSFTHL